MKPTTPGSHQKKSNNIDKSKTFFCSVANVGLTDFSRIVLGDSQGRGSKLHQKFPPPSSLTRYPIYRCLIASAEVSSWKVQFGPVNWIHF